MSVTKYVALPISRICDPNSRKCLLLGLQHYATRHTDWHSACGRVRRTETLLGLISAPQMDRPTYRVIAFHYVLFASQIRPPMFQMRLKNPSVEEGVGGPNPGRLGDTFRFVSIRFFTLHLRRETNVRSCHWVSLRAICVSRL